MTRGTTRGFKKMSDLIITLFSDGSLMDVGTLSSSLMEDIPAIYAVEYDGKEYAIDDEYYYKNQRNAKELTIKLLVYDNEVHIEKVDI